MDKKLIIALFALTSLVILSCERESFIESQLPEKMVSVIDPWTGVDISEYDKTLPLDKLVTVSAGYNLETKSHLELNGEDNHASVVWDSADSFEMLGYHIDADPEQTGWYYSTFTAATGGERVNFTPDYLVPASTYYHSFYLPLSEDGVKKTSDESFGFGIRIPTVQTATANGLQKGLNFAYARTDAYDADLYFKNMLALVRFKLSGSVASSVTSITLRGASPLAGDCVMVPDAEGTPQITFSKAFVEDVASNTVRLEGTFSTDTWYYMAVAPGTQTALSFSFSDGSKVTTKVAVKTVTFNRGRVTSIGTINLGSELEADDPYKTIKHKTATSGHKPVTFAVVPEGFTAGEMATYEALAKTAVNTLFEVEPFKSYQEYFNVYILKVPSNESGARIANGTVAEQNRDCYFESSWNSGDKGYGNMRANDNKVFRYVEENCPDILDGTHTIQEVPVLMIINDTRYGGKNWTFSDGKAYCMAPYTWSGAPIGWSYPTIEAVSDNDPSAGTQETPDERYSELGFAKGSASNTGNWLNTLVHEFGGHCFSRLKDEYWYEDTLPAVSYLEPHRWDYLYGGVPFGLNISVSYSNPGYDDPDAGAEYIKPGWQHLLDNKTSLVSTNVLYNRIGIYQGADVSPVNRWRSERISCMIDNRFYFSTFQRELIVRRIMALANVDISDDAAFMASFWAKDVPTDPVRDIIGSPVIAPFNQDPVKPRIMPMLPPPRLVEVYPGPVIQ